jgi:hypothetical protein
MVGAVAVVVTVRSSVRRWPYRQAPPGGKRASQQGRTFIARGRFISRRFMDLDFTELPGGDGCAAEDGGDLRCWAISMDLSDSNPRDPELRRELGAAVVDTCASAMFRGSNQRREFSNLGDPWPREGQLRKGAHASGHASLARAPRRSRRWPSIRLVVTPAARRCYGRADPKGRPRR